MTWIRFHPFVCHSCREAAQGHAVGCVLGGKAQFLILYGGAFSCVPWMVTLSGIEIEICLSTSSANGSEEKEKSNGLARVSSP